MGEPIHVSAQAWDKLLQSDLPVLVDFWAEWCAPCHMIAPSVERIAQEYDGILIVAKLDTDANPEIATRYNVQGIPTLIIFNNGEPVDRVVGAVPYTSLKMWVEQTLARIKYVSD